MVIDLFEKKNGTAADKNGTADDKNGFADMKNPFSIFQTDEARDIDDAAISDINQDSDVEEKAPARNGRSEKSSQQFVTQLRGQAVVSAGVVGGACKNTKKKGRHF